MVRAIQWTVIHAMSCCPYQARCFAQEIPKEIAWQVIGEALQVDLPVPMISVSDKRVTLAWYYGNKAFTKSQLMG